MKLKLAVLILMTALSFDSFAQWEPDVRLTNGPSSSSTISTYGNARSIASSGNVLHVVWCDTRDGNSEIYYKKSEDGGNSWGEDRRLSNDNLHSVCPSIAVSGLLVHIIWNDYTSTDNIHYRHSTDGGESWEAETLLTNQSGHNLHPSISVSGSSVHAVWYRYFVPWEPRVYYRRSTNDGKSWGAEVLLENGLSLSSVASSGQFVHVVMDGIRYKRSTNWGESWGNTILLTNFTSGSRNPSIGVSDSLVHVVGESFRDGNVEIYYKRSTDGGESWGADTLLTNNTLHSILPSVSASGASVHVVWYDNRDDNYEIYYKRSINGGALWEDEIRLTNNTFSSMNPSVAVSGSAVNVVWTDDRDGHHELYYRRDPTGNPTRIITTSMEIPDNFHLFQNYPNPFNPVTLISYSLVTGGHTTLKVFDILGNEVITLVNEKQNAGSYTTEFDGSNLASGIYYYKLKAGNFSDVKKMMLVK